MLRFLFALLLVLPLVVAPVISARAHVGAEGCVTAVATGEHHSGHVRASGEGGQGAHHAPAPDKKRAAAIPCCLTICPGVPDFNAQRLSVAVLASAAPRLSDESAVGQAVEPAEPPPRHHA